MRRLSVLTAAVVVGVVAAIGLAPGSSVAQHDGEGSLSDPAVTLFAGGVGVNASYTVHCPAGAEGFKISTTIANVNRLNGMIAEGAAVAGGECDSGDFAFGFQILSGTGVGYTRGPFGGGHQLCFGPILDDGEVDCEPGGGGLIAGSIG